MMKSYAWLTVLLACCVLAFAPLGEAIPDGDQDVEQSLAPGAASAEPSASVAAHDGAGIDDPRAAVRRFRMENPGSLLFRRSDRITRVYGSAFGFGDDPHQVAEAFRLNHAGLFGLAPEDLEPVSLLADGRHTQPVMYLRDTGQYKFTLVCYSQFRDAIPVFRADLRLLIRDEANHPLVLAAANLRDLGDFTPKVGAVDVEAGIASAIRAVPDLVNFTDSELVIWAGVDDMAVEPALGLTFVGDNCGTGAAAPAKRLFVTDAVSGRILYQENMIIETDVVGNVSGVATQGVGADVCEPEAQEPMLWARVQIAGGNVDYTDANGDFVIPHGGSSQVTVESPIRGRWFRVFNFAGSDTVLSQDVIPPGPANFVHNADNSSEYRRAEVNAYIEANVVRDFTLTYNPSYPQIATETEFPVNVNRSNNCNAYYDYSSINFYTSGGGCSNTANTTVVHHEYGHHLVYVGGSGQGAYGEGMGDVVGVLITDTPDLGVGFYSSNCSSGIRTADNNCQYQTSGCSSCGSEIHACGQLISGCVWSTRNELLVTHPSDYIDILANLAVNSILLHSGTGINPSITIDYLTLDDDDGNLDNGTPHWDEICVGFGAHNMDCPELATGLSVTPAGDLVSEGPNGGPFTPGSIAYTLENLGPDPIDYSVTNTRTWVTVTNGSGSLNVGAMTNVTVSINANADSLDDGSYNDTISFVNLTDHVGDTTRDVTLNVGVPTVIYEWTLDTDPGWSTQGLWAWGQPTGGGGQYGGPDPTSGYTGPNVYGYNLNGDYENSLPERHLTSGAIDCTGLSNVTLRFWRWLGVEQPIYDHAYVRVSNDGSNWTTVWQNPSQVADTAWTQVEYNLSAVADDRPTVYLRWTMGATDSSWQFCGWNIDDIQIIAIGGGPEPTCSDGILNQGEDRIDCGGPCPPCDCLSDGVCGDGQFCNGAETCDEYGHCLPGVPVDCDDGVGCTVDSCNEATDSCDNVPDDLACDDGLFCNGTEFCDPVLDCEPGTDPCPGEDCDELNDICVPLICDDDGMCEESEDCTNCPNDCFTGEGAVCGNGVCEAGNGEDCLSCPEDCNGRQNGRPSRRFCCGDGDGENWVDCLDPRCNGGGNSCSEDPTEPSCCGDGFCDGTEDVFNCEIDCGLPPLCGDDVCDVEFGENSCNCEADCGNPLPVEVFCADGLDDDCDGLIDCEDGDCADDPVCCGVRGDPCSTDGECCTGWCHRGRCK